MEPQRLAQWQSGIGPRNAPVLPICLGLAHSGAHHGCLQRATAIALVPLLVWLVASLVAHVGGDHPTVAEWLDRSVVAMAMVVLQVALFWHMMSGWRVLVEDYVHADRVEIATLIAVDLVCHALMAIGVFTSMDLAFH